MTENEITAILREVPTQEQKRRILLYYYFVHEIDASQLAERIGDNLTTIQLIKKYKEARMRCTRTYLFFKSINAIRQFLRTPFFVVSFILSSLYTIVWIEIVGLSAAKGNVWFSILHSLPAMFMWWAIGIGSIIVLCFVIYVIYRLIKTFLEWI